MSRLSLIFVGSLTLLIGITIFDKVMKPSSASFVAVPMPVEVEPTQVVVAGLPSCPHSGKETQSLLNQLATANIPHKNITSFSFANADDWHGVYQLNEIMKQGAPVVFVNGKAKSKPSSDEVIAEYRRMTK